ncbi:DUF998 domain-containing protein [Saccharopolyspora sp. WRP15-2]|uniref:DUF998 domain-containing protein n=1 Tax=Saccharopolyspora oryzae TaxID=2997343 RepID=A0ABT4UZP1_9PSEU|nr:DUF998 domain-containing protein [Saccharopolyspora oryzae]MDA3627179.1 DUF998 domain-containing protein [Saccharopolyspora oryzae]
MAPLLFIVVILIQGELRSGYDPLHHWGSELSLGDQGWIQIANFIATGALTITFAVGLRRVLAGGPGAAAIPLLAGAFGLELIIQGIFTADPYVGYPVGSKGTTDYSLSGWVHNLNMFPTFAALTAAVLAVAYRSARNRELAWAVLSVIVAILIPAAIVVAANSFDMDTQVGRYHGLWQRIGLGITGIWYALYAVRLLRRTLNISPRAGQEVRGVAAR